MKRLMTSLIFTLFALALASSAFAEGVTKRPYQAQYVPPTIANPGVPVGYAYWSLAGSYLNTSEDFFSDHGQWRGGLALGYIAKWQDLGFGVDVDALRHFNDEEFAREIDNWNISLRGRIGYFMSPTFMPYLTAGYARAFAENTFVWGVGAEHWVSDRMSLKLEVVQYTASALEDLVEAKASLNFKF